MVTYELYQLKVSQLRPSSWYSLSALLFLYSLEPSSFFQSAAGGRSCTHREISVGLLEDTEPYYITGLRMWVFGDCRATKYLHIVYYINIFTQ